MKNHMRVGAKMAAVEINLTNNYMDDLVVIPQPIKLIRETGSFNGGPQLHSVAQRGPIVSSILRLSDGSPKSSRRGGL